MALGFWVCLIAALNVVTSAYPKPNASTAHPEPNPTAPSSPCIEVKMASRTLLCLRHGVEAFSAQERAHAIANRFETLALNPSFAVDSLGTVQSGDDFDIIAGDITLMRITPQDALDLGPSVEEVAHDVVAKAKEALVEHRAGKGFRELLVAGAYTLGTLLAFVLLLFGLSRLFPRIYAKVDSLQGRRFRTLRLQSIDILSAERITALVHSLIKMLRIALTLVLVYLFVPLVLSFFPWTASWAPLLINYVTTPIKEILGVTIDYIPSLFFVIVVIVVTVYSLKFVRFLFDQVDKGNVRLEGFHREWASPTYKLVRVFVVAFAFVMAFPYLPGSDSPAFQGVSVFIGLLLSFGSSSAISNIVSGVVITYMRPFRLGDRVKIADTVGDVVEKSLLVTRLRTIKNVDVTIPNSMVLGSHIVNYSSSAESTGLILHASVTIGYNVPWPKVHELLERAAARTEHVMKNPKPFVLQTSLGDFSVAYEINAYTGKPSIMVDTYSKLNQHIQDVFAEAGVEIMSPHYTSLRDGSASTVPETSAVQ